MGVPLVFRALSQKGTCRVSDLSSVSNVCWKNNLFLLLGKNKYLHPPIITLGTVCDSSSVRSYIKCSFSIRKCIVVPYEDAVDPKQELALELEGINEQTEHEPPPHPTQKKKSFKLL